MEGPLSKWTNVMKGWQYRWFVLDDDAGMLSYYTSKEKMARGARRGCIRLKGAIVGIDDEDDSTFTVTVDGKIFHMQARDAEERELWIRVLEDSILRQQEPYKIFEKWDSSKPVPTVEDFDNKLSESDAFLQILIEQIKNLTARINKCENGDEKLNYIAVTDKANVMLDSVKHTIVLLQIAKNTLLPVSGISSPESSIPVSFKPVNNDLSDKQEISTSTISCKSLPENSVGSKSKLADISQTEEIQGQSTFMPEMSYSSSEDEDYYDANEYHISGSNVDSNKSNIGISIPAEFEPLKMKTPPLVSRCNFLNEDGTIDYDVLYEDDSEEDIGSLEGHGFVISHLISQVKIGMDLTKVPLPTFILERRSLLEMYADFFAHPNLFIGIVDGILPQDRFVSVLRWYLSAFHAGRKGEVAKKPYNPILGEIFKCFWETNSNNNVMNSDHPLIQSGPIPWADNNKLVFIAEQVSHHPPVSAFYAEHISKRISCCAHIWTKSRFLGLSIGVRMIGQGCISLLDYDEEYIITFPNGYGRSILTVPWVELGGEVSITCAKTGYSAQIEFHTKPFYGGKKHRITAEAFQPNEKKPFLVISGEWNGIINTKSDSGSHQVFVDTHTIPIIQKNVKPISQQENIESRRLWKDVTAGLRLGKIDKATEAKLQLEQMQRNDAKYRTEKCLRWETKYFSEVGGNWVYNNPLQKRLHQLPDFQS